ncbi:MAG: UDP-3-O-acyl-N-acetylglucosamine deacetylase [candidate division WOR-3 bacterium]
METEDNKKKVWAEGWGIFTRQLVKIYLSPAPIDFGIMINGIPLNLKNISFHHHQVSFKEILMPEHFLSVCYGLGIDNLEVGVDGNEFPFFDGSGEKYLNLFKSAGIKTQNKPKNFLLIKSPVIEFDRDSFIAILPGENLELNITFSYPPLNSFTPFLLANLTPAIYEKEIVWARTFGKYPFPSFLKRIGLAYRKKKNIFYPKRLSSPEEFIRHKILDLLGDLKALGKYLRGKIFTHNPSHKLNYKILREIAESEYGH